MKKHVSDSVAALATFYSSPVTAAAARALGCRSRGKRPGPTRQGCGLLLRLTEQHRKCLAVCRRLTQHSQLFPPTRLKNNLEMAAHQIHFQVHIFLPGVQLRSAVRLIVQRTCKININRKSKEICVLKIFFFVVTMPHF